MINGFVMGTPESVGIPSEAVLAFMNRLKEEKRNVQGFMLYRHGKLVAKCIAPPYDFESKRHVYSISKSFTGTAIGIARDEGLLNLSDRVIDFFPESLPEEISPNLARMTVHDLLSMSCGHDCCPASAMLNVEDWVKFFLAREVPYVPGTRFVYNSGGTYMLSAIITKLTGLKLIDYLRPRLFDPLGITDVSWDECPRGINLGGWGLRVSHVDMLKLGIVYLNGGTYEGKRIVSRDWTMLASSYKIDNDVDDGNDWGMGYCYQLWRCQHNCYRGDGMCGQLLIVSPDRDMILSLISEDNSFQDICDAYWDTIFASASGNLPSYRNDPKFTEEMAAGDVLPENPEALAALRSAEDNWTAVELLGDNNAKYGKFSRKITLTGSLASSAEITVEDNSAEFTLNFRDGQVKKVRASSGAWVVNHYGEFHRDVVEFMVAQKVAPVSLGASFSMEGDKIFVNTQATNSPHGFRFTIDFGAGKITKSRTLPPYHTETFAFTEA